MSKKTDIQARVDEAMDSVVNINHAMPEPFFYTRLQARLEKRQKSVWENLTRMITRPAFAVLSLSLIILLNAFVILNESSAKKSPEYSEMAVADEYVRASTYYDLENVIP